MGLIEIAVLCFLGAIGALIAWTQARRRPPRQAPPGWHSDLVGESTWRWWDGNQWTSQVAN
jgi:hypothetical protein